MTWRYAGQRLVTGLLVALPLAITLYVLFWILALIEMTMRALLQWAIPERFYIPGMGLFIGLALLFVFGMLLQAWTVRRFWLVLESKIECVPVVKSIYGAVRDLMGFFSNSGKRDFDQVVLVKTNAAGDAKLLGFVTRSDCNDLPPAFGEGDRIAVYLPMSYQIGGFTVFVPRARVEPVSMSMEDAMRFALTAGVTSQKDAIVAMDDEEAEALAEESDTVAG